MKIKDGIKAGVGFTIGMTLAGVALNLLSNEIKKGFKKQANNEELMEKLKTENPEAYEILKKYIDN